MPANRPRKGRLLIALVIAVFAVTSYLMRTEINPVTGEKQRVAFSVDQEVALGLESAPRMAEQMGGTVDPRTRPLVWSLRWERFS
jgi:hypothetical protein